LSRSSRQETKGEAATVKRAADLGPRKGRGLGRAPAAAGRRRAVRSAMREGGRQAGKPAAWILIRGKGSTGGGI